MSEPAQIVSFRIDPDMLAQLRDIANQQGCTVSDLMRRGALMALEEPNRMVITWTTPPAVTMLGSPQTIAPASALEEAALAWWRHWRETIFHPMSPEMMRYYNDPATRGLVTACADWAATEDASGPADPGEGDGTGAGQREAHGGSQGAMDAAIEEYLRCAFAVGLIHSGWYDGADEPDPANLLQWHHCFDHPNCHGPGCKACAGSPYTSDLIWSKVDKFGHLTKAASLLRQAVAEELARTTGLDVRKRLREILAFHNAEFLAEYQIDERVQEIIDLIVPAARLQARPQVVEQFTAALLTGLDDLERDDHWGTLVRPGDVADLVHRVALEVRGG